MRVTLLVQAATEPNCYSRLTNEWICGQYIVDRKDEIVDATVEHILITVAAVALGVLIAFPLALIARRYPRLESGILGVSTGIYTIPSLALFQILVGFSFLGLDRTTVEIALVSYTLLILFRNTLAGLRSVPDEVREAAEGMGLTRRQVLMKVELPLALPAVFAGLRVATVTVISLATVAAFIDDEGLGSPIFRAIQSNVFKTELFAAGGLAVALALFADGALVLIQRLLTPWARRQRA